MSAANNQGYSTEEFGTAFGIAKEALQLVGQFQTPPTPDVYSVWYHYVEGQNEALKEQLDFAVNDSKRVDRSIIGGMYQQHFGANDLTEINEQTSQGLATEMVELQNLIHTQLSSGSDFSESVQEANDRLSGDTVSADDVRSSVAMVLKSNATMQQQLEEMRQQLEESQELVDSMRRTLVDSQQQMMKDPLTGVGNRRSFDYEITRITTEKYDPQSHIFLALIDLDNFKPVNDQYGHDSGDIVLKFAAAEMQRIGGVDARVTRFGGDEFAMFYATPEVDAGNRLAEDVLEAISQQHLEIGETGQQIGKVTASIGVALLREDDDQASWFERADKLLYRAKDAGRNRVLMERNLTQR